ncbi:MAG: ExeM/NucH family extracellular endonuclease [Roseiflexaceae bacterium]
MALLLLISAVAIAHPTHADSTAQTLPFNLAISGNATLIESAPSIASTSPTNGATNVIVNTAISLTFSEPVTVTDSWFNIACTGSGVHSASVSGGPTSFALNPDADFANGESCAVTVVASQVADQDADDPPDTMAANYSFSFTTIASPNCGDPATLIHTIQGSGTASPLAGSNVTIEGVVVGDYQGSGQLGGYHVQEEAADADADPATSEGIFVADTSFPVSVGDMVRVTGTIAELPSGSASLTQLSGVSSTSICSSGQSDTPTAVMLPITSLGNWERYEGMLIHIAQNLSVTENFTLGRYGEVSLSAGGRLDNPTNVVAPGVAAIARQDLNDRSRILLDDGNGQQNIDPTIYPSGGLSASNTLRSGDTVNGLTGVLEQRFGVYRVQPVGPISFSASNPRGATPEPISGTLKIASFNVLNYFNGNGLGGGFPTSRGATTAAEFTRQRAKIISALLAIDADVVGLMEIENDAKPNSAVEDLVGGLNAVAGAGAYAFIDTGLIGTDAIRVALIYQPASVTPIGDYAILDSSVDSRFIDTRNRPSLAQTFEEVGTGERITIAVNHLKSKGSACSGDPDTGDGQGNCNSTRTNAASALVDWLTTDPTASGDADYLIIGDMNSYAKEDPIGAILNAGYTDLIDQFIGSAEAYSYVFDGQSGYLDHALASTTLITQVTGLAEWHINADEPIALDYNVEFKSANHINTLYSAGPYRSSDHDPVIVGLNLGASSTQRKIYLPLVVVGG